MSFKPGNEKVLVSHTGHRLVRRTAFRFALDLTGEQEGLCRQYAGAARLAYNHHIGRVKANLGQRAAEISYGITAAELTPALSWSKVAFINEMNAWKNGKAADSPVNDDTGERGPRSTWPDGQPANHLSRPWPGHSKTNLRAPACSGEEPIATHTAPHPACPGPGSEPAEDRAPRRDGGRTVNKRPGAPRAEVKEDRCDPRNTRSQCGHRHRGR